jgi:hypothetical protein
VNVEPAEFADPQPRAVEDFTDRAVQRGPGVVTPVVVEQGVELLTDHDLGQSMVRSRRREPGGRALL